MVEAILKERGRTLTGDTHPERGYFFRSDHFSFAKVGVPAISLSEPKQFTGPNAAELLKKQEAYNDKDYHQPSDQYDPSWDFTGGVNDMRVLAQLGWRIAQQAGDAEVQRRRSVRGSEKEVVELVTLDGNHGRARADSRHGARIRRCWKCPGPAFAKASAGKLSPSPQALKTSSPLFLKAESLQPMGAFKIRGAFNMIAQLPKDNLAARRDHLFIRQSRPGRGDGGAEARRPGGDRDADDGAAGEDRRLQVVRRRSDHGGHDLARSPEARRAGSGAIAA